MIKHLFKLIWNQKRKNALLILEIFISFLVMFGVSSMLLYNYHNYKQPLGFEFEDVWIVNLDLAIDRDSTKIPHQQELKHQLEAFPEVEKLSFSNSNVPFSMTTHNAYFKWGEIGTMTNVFDVDEHYAEVMGIRMLAGRWYNKADEAAKYTPVVITENLKAALFGTAPALEELIRAGDVDYKVIGIAENFKYRDFEETGNSLFLPFGPSNVFEAVMMLKMRPGVEASFEPRLAKTVSAIIKGRQNEVEQLSAKRETQIQLVWVPMIILLIVCGFLIFNVILGLFGILWYNISKRKNEIGLRRAMGATQSHITGQFIGEIIFVATLGVLLGAFFAVQFPILKVFGISGQIYGGAILLSSLLIYGIVIVCAFYPSKQAANIHPALALHQD